MSANATDEATAQDTDFSIEDAPHEDPVDVTPAKPDAEPKPGEPGPEPEPQPEPAPEPPPEPPPAEPEPEPPAEPPAEPAPDAEPAPEAFAFDPAPFGIGENSMVAKRLAECTTEAEAFQVLANEHARLQGTYGRHTQEVHDVRTENERLQAELANRPIPSGTVAEPAPGAAPVQDAQPNLNEWIGQTWDDNPQAVVQYIANATLQHVQQQVQRQQETALAEHDVNRELQAEFLAFQKDHPDWEEHHDEMDTVAKDLGSMPPYGDCLELALLYEQKDKADVYRGVRDLMKQGLPFAEAREFHDLRAGKTGVDQDAQKKAKENAARRAAQAATAAGGPARGTTPAEQPVTGFSIEDGD